MLHTVAPLFLVIWVHIVRSQLKDEWMLQGHRELQEALRLRHNTGVAKNIILFLGDGMGVSTVTAARIYKGQRNGDPGEETQLNFDKFPHVAFAKTYNTDKQVPDSAGTATAFLSGVKANFGTLGVDARVARGNCSNMAEGRVTSIMDWAVSAGKSVGLVTTTRVTHATVAAAYAHTPERDWESDSSMPQAPAQCAPAKVKDIASQLIDENPDVKVVLGGGRQHFLPYSALVPGTEQLNLDGRLDGRDLTQVWLDRQHRKGQRAHYVWNKQQLESLHLGNVDSLLGLFHQDHMSFHELRNITGVVQEPSLADMTRAAITVLNKNPQGYFLLVEGGRIDHGHHYNSAHLALTETLSFDDAVAVAKEMTREETLIVVTADHSHVLTIAGYPDRGHDILGTQDPESDHGATDGLPYATLSYANGPGPGRVNLTGVDTSQVFHQQSRLVPTRYETHAGEDVGVFASGPMAHLLHAVHEQSYLAHVMAYAACIGPDPSHCQHVHSSTGSPLVTNPPMARVTFRPSSTAGAPDLCPWGVPSRGPAVTVSSLLTLLSCFVLVGFMDGSRLDLL